MTDDYKPKLIEVALPLAAINDEAAREKSIRFGHPSTLHLWWARRPLAATRAVVWASLVDDPSCDSSLSVEEQESERGRLFRILERLVEWNNSDVADVIADAQAEIDRCYPDGPPSILDPFGGGGAIPLETQRLGLRAFAGDLNPVAVLIQRAMIEIPPRFAARRPVHPSLQSELATWSKAQGLAADVTAYGDWMRREAKRQVGHLYPDEIGDTAGTTTIAWLWARTVASPDPSWTGKVPLVSSWVLAKKPGQPKVWIEPEVDHDDQTITYQIRTGGEPKSEGTCSGGNGTCLATGAAITSSYIKAEGKAGRMGTQLLAVVVDGESGRAYRQPTEADYLAAAEANPPWEPVGNLPEKGLGFRVQAYGLDRWAQLFTPRQLTTLATYTDLVSEARSKVLEDATQRGMPQDGVALRDGGHGANAYADAVATYLALGVSRLTDMCNSLCRWESSRTQVRNLFGRQAISMIWDFAENNVFNDAGGDFKTSLASVVRALERLPATGFGETVQRDARARVRELPDAVISTDPPYYDNVGYADLSDFFFVWLRRSLGGVWPDECATLSTPKSEEMIADPTRHGGPAGARGHFESSMAEFMEAVAETQNRSAPATIYYAYKATERSQDGVRSTGWDTFLQAVLDAGFQVTATWPMRTELANRMRGQRSNALASSIVISCRPRAVGASLASTGEFLSALRAELPEAVATLRSGNIAPVDMAQSTIGPGIKIFSRYARVVEADGSTMSVSDALLHVNNILGEVLDGEDADLDRDSRFALSWFGLHGYEPGPAGDADSQARSKGTAVAGVVASGIAATASGRVRLLKRDELDPDWDPVDDNRLTVWEATQHLIAALDRSESEAAQLLAKLGGYGESARSLAYVLFKKASDKAWAEEASAYNTLITAWPSLLEHGATVNDGQQRLV